MIDTDDYNLFYFGTSGSLLEIPRFRCGFVCLCDLVGLIVMIHHGCVKLIAQLDWKMREAHTGGNSMIGLDLEKSMRNFA